MDLVPTPSEIAFNYTGFSIFVDGGDSCGVMETSSAD